MFIPKFLEEPPLPDGKISYIRNQTAAHEIFLKCYSQILDAHRSLAKEFQVGSKHSDLIIPPGIFFEYEVTLSSPIISGMKSFLLDERYSEKLLDLAKAMFFVVERV